MNIAIVTGASSGLGGCFVHLLDEQEKLDEIWVIARREQRLNALKSQVKTPLRVLPLDLSDKAAVRSLSELLSRENPSVRVLINAAGFGKIGRWDDISLDDTESMIDLNCRAAVAVTRVTLPFMSEGARIMQICSTAAFQPFPYLGIYAASKAFLYRYTRALRIELMPRRIKVTAVCPYWINDTEFIAVARRTQDSSYIKHFPLASREKRVARWAMADSRLGLPVSTPGPVCLIHRIIAKIVPSEIMMGLWELIRRI